MTRPRRANGHWEDVILPAAAEIVDASRIGVTLRQVFYRLVAAELIANKSSEYVQLSRRTAESRRAGLFPRLADQTREIHRPLTFDSVQAALEWLPAVYRRDRTDEQNVAIYLGVEKNTMLGLLQSWFRDLGVPIVPLRGYSSQTYVDDVIDDIEEQGREAVLIYAGDFDPSGEEILRDFEERTNGCLDVVRIALTPEQVEQYDLPPQMGKSTDSRASRFIAKHGRLVQVELEALPSETLRELYQYAIDEFLDASTFETVRQDERHQRDALAEFVSKWEEE